MKVVKKGDVFAVVCDYCGAGLEYTLKDVDEYGIVECPECHNSIAHTKDNLKK